MLTTHASLLAYRAGMEVSLHPWNVDFEWIDHHGPFRVVTEEQARSFDENGFFVLDNLVSPEQLDAARVEIDHFEAELTEALRQNDQGGRSIADADAITFTGHLVTRSPLLRDLARSQMIADLCADLLGPDVRMYWDQAVYKKPEKPRRFPWHQDNGYTFIAPQQYLTVWLALTDATEENGCPQVVPGLHRRGTLAHHYVEPLGWEIFDDPPQVVAAPVKAGGAVVFSSLTPHLTGPNVTDAVRKAYILQYAPEGVEVQRGDPEAGPPTHTEAQDDPDRQFQVLVGGKRVTA